MSEQNINVIDREGDAHVIPWGDDQVLMEALRDNDMPILASCGGTESCATCHVYLEKDVIEKLQPRSDDEIELLTDAEGFDADCSRLSCQVAYDEDFADITVTIAPEDE
ncbi:2Fe-2S iron-sulfur cluster-binding protein [Corynebacterium guangdongense]|uniref:2Fe-2S ferredoxin n=1 Tax=Corynebacterium guangdongense TaxID=1783348 RepID=A0ABU2A0G8_9CORY|nr:2Fe-2S iron-sulfur cluster-binding protein [Corynebacterium guangdongense]MDR7330683.1 2Fe-2S ferredoxin [Corynebacterium guangdongense]WJZ16698.1 Rhodocoxin [Corynebacterium guangdongense]